MPHIQNLGEMLSAENGLMKPNWPRNDKTRTVPRAIAFELGRTAHNPAIYHFQVWGGGGEVLVRFSRCAWTHSVQIQEVKRIAALLEIGTCSSGDDTVCDGFRVTLRGDGEDVVGLIA